MKCQHNRFWRDPKGKCVACRMKSAEETEKKRIASLETKLAEAIDALQLLYDNQNGCPLSKYEVGWNDAMRRATAVLNEHGGIRKGQP